MSEKAERIIALIIELYKRGPLTAEKIRKTIPGYARSKSLDAFRKMFERDRTFLQDLGINIVYGKFNDDDNAYYFDGVPTIKSRLSLMTSEKHLLADVLAEILSFDAVVNPDDLRSAVYKIASSFGILPQVLEKEPTLRFVLNVTEEEQRMCEVIKVAIEDGKAVKFEYRPFHSLDYKEYKCCPKVLSLRDGEWYMVGTLNDSVRFFKLKRMKNLEIIDCVERCEQVSREEIIEGLKQKPWEYETGEEVEVTVRCPLNMSQLLERKFNAIVSETDSESCLLKFKVKSVNRFLLYFSQFLSSVEIIEPQFLRQTIVDNLKKILEAELECLEKS